MNEDDFTFEADEEGKSYALSIARIMVQLFDIPLSEAIGRINNHWEGQSLIGPQMIYHRDEEFWAKTIYYESGTYWWLDWWMVEHTPKPKPYPKVQNKT